MICTGYFFGQTDLKWNVDDTVCFASTTEVLSIHPVCHFVLLFCEDFDHGEVAGKYIMMFKWKRNV